MGIFLKSIGVSLAGGAALLMALTVVSSPAEARRGKGIGRIVAGAAAVTVTKAAIRKARADATRDEDEDKTAENAPAEAKTVESNEKPMDHAARTKAVLDAESKTEVQVINAPANGEAAVVSSGETVCYAGCNPVPQTPPRTVQSLREQYKSR